MAEFSDDEIKSLNEEAQTFPEGQGEATSSSLSSSQITQKADPPSAIAVEIPSFNLNEGSFNRPHFGPETNTHHVEANQIEYANITHHHTHYHKEGQESQSDDVKEPSKMRDGKKSRVRKRSKSDVPEGYVKLSDDLYMDKRKPLRSGTQVFNGHIRHASGLKQKIVIKKIVPCDEKNLREVDHLVNLSPHPNVVRVLRSVKYESITQTHSELYIAMELCQSKNLHDYLIENRKEHKPFDFAQTLSYAKQLVNGMKHIHAHRIIHKDIKPENILLSLDGTQIKVSDFGISKQLQGSRTRTKLTSLGTDGFRAPETFHSDTISMMSDIYSMAITLFFMFTTGLHPFGDDEHLQIYNMKNGKGLDLSRLPGEMGRTMKKLLIDLLHKMLQLDPVNRPTIEEIANNPFFTMDSSEVSDRLSQGLDNSDEDFATADEGQLESEEESVSEEVVEQLPEELQMREPKPKSNCFRWFIIISLAIAVCSIALGMYFKEIELRQTGIQGTLHLRSKFLHGGLGKPHLRADFSYAYGKPPLHTTLEVRQKRKMRKELMKYTSKLDLTKWIVSIYFDKPDFETKVAAHDFRQGFRICHKCAPLKELRPKSFNVSVSYDVDIQSVELVDVVPLSQKCFDVAPETTWLGIIFWFDDETLEWYAINLGDLEAHSIWNLGSPGTASRRSLPLGIPVVILTIERYKEFFEKGGTGEHIIWTQTWLYLGGCTNSQLKVLFTLKYVL